MNRLHLVGFVTWGWLLFVGCGSSSGSICARGDDCGIIGDQPVEECMERVDDGVDDGRVSPGELNDCAVCIEDPDNSCTDLFSECASECDEVYAEIILGR